MLTISSLPMGSIILAPRHMHPILNQKLLEDKNGSVGIRFDTLKQYITSFFFVEKHEEAEILFAYRKCLIPILNQLKIYREVALSAAFLKECYAFITDLKTFSISPSSLSEETASHQELKLIITTLYPILMEADILQKAYALFQTKDASHIYIYHTLASPFEQRCIDLLLQHGAHLLEDDLQQEYTYFYNALNKRQEVESVAQIICNQHLYANAVSIAICEPSYLPILHQIFERYHIPYTDMSNQTKTSSLIQQSKLLLQYYLEPNQSNLLACLDCGLFHHEHLQALLQYLQIFTKDFFQPFCHLKTLQYESHVVSEKDIHKLADLEEKAELARQTLSTILYDFIHSASMEEMLLKLLSFVKEVVEDDSNELTCFLQLQKLFQTILSELHTKEDLNFLLSLLDDINLSTSSNSMHGVNITTSVQDQCAYPFHFVLGATQKNYPAFPLKSGIFNERYYTTIPYPSMEERYQLHLKQMEHALSKHKTLYVFYPVGTYEGKALEPALEIEQHFNKQASAYPLIENYINIKPDFYLPASLAKELYVKNHKIHGSISSIERYIQCPFSYFLRYGLGISEPMKLGFSDSYMGTLAHFVMESITSKYQKDYVNNKEAIVEEIIDNEIQAMAEVFPNMEKRLQNLRLRILSSMLQTLKRLAAFEQHSSFTPYLQEKEFYYDIPISKDIQFAFHGFVDRVDKMDDILCILDYKSSAKTLSEDKVFAALQLQLVTYAIILHKMEEKDIMGAYYISLKNENILNPAGKISRRKPVQYIEYGKDELDSELLKTHQFSGWTMRHDIHLLDDDATHIKGVRCDKDGNIKSRKVYDIEKLEDNLLKVYQVIAKRIVSGDNKIEPSEHACTYCKFHEICHFEGMPFKRNPLIEIEKDSLLLPEVNEDGEL